MAIRKAKYDTGFAQIPNRTLQDHSISHTSRSILFDLLSRPDDWKITQEVLAKSLNISVQTLQKYINELKTAGYVEYVRYKKNGKIVGGDYLVYPVPQDDIKNRSNPDKHREVSTPLNFHGMEVSSYGKVGDIQRKSHTKKESISKPEQAQAEMKPTFEFDLVLAWLFTQFEKLGNSFSESDRVFIEAALQDYVDEARKPTKATAYSWIEQALINRFNVMQRSHQNSEARNRRTKAVVAAMDATSANLNDKTKNSRPVNTIDKLTNTDWADDDIFQEMECYNDFR